MRCELSWTGSEDRSGLLKEKISVKAEYILTFSREHSVAESRQTIH
jgi:hypothetical protein